MKIGFDSKRFFFNRTGLGNYSRDLIRIMSQYFPENDYVKYSPKQPKNLEFDSSNLVIPRTFLDKTFPSLWRNQRIVKDLIRDNINIYHGLSGEIPVGISKSSVKSVVTVHDLIFRQYPQLYNPIDRVIYNRKTKYAVHHAERIVAISQQTKQDIIQFYNIASENIEVIYQGCHPAFKTSKNEEQKNSIRSKYNLPENFVLNVGSIEARKNAFQIVKAIENIDIPLIIIGKDTKYSQEIRNYVIKNNLEKRVFFLKGFSMEELSIIYSMADIFIYPSKYEGFGIPIIEALYSGTPVITTNSGVFPEAGGPFSKYINPENTEEMTSAIQFILTNSDTQKNMSEKGLEYAQKFNDDILAKQWNTLYKKTL